MQYIVLQNARGFVGESFDAFTPQTSTFADGEVSVNLEGLDYKSPKSFAIVASVFGQNSLFEILFTISTIARNSTKPIHLLIPYLGYARQDREISPNAPISAKIIADLICSQAVTTISVMEMHSQQVQGFFTKPCFNISLKGYFSDFKKILSAKLADKQITLDQFQNFSVVVAPDVGAAKNARQVANNLGVPLAIIEKFRYGPGESEVIGITGDVKGKICYIFDDIIDSAGTLCNAAQLLKDSGAIQICAFAAHGIFSGKAQERIENSEFLAVWVSKSIFHTNLTSKKIGYIEVFPFVKDEFEKRIENF